MPEHRSGRLVTLGSAAIGAGAGEPGLVRPGLASLFDQLGIDYCCGGNRPLAEACNERDLDPQTVVALLNASADQTGPGDERVDELTNAELIEHIVTRHHVYLRRELPRIREIAGKVATGHGKKEPRLTEVAAICDTLASDLLRHADEEENELFPAILEGTKGVDVAGFIDDHEAVGAQLARLRELTDAHTVPEWACNTTRALYHSLGELEQDVHRHVHKENNILFPRVAG